MCQDRVIDIEELNNKWDAILDRRFESPTMDDVFKYRPMVQELLSCDSKISMQVLKKKYAFYHKHSFLNQIIQCLKFLDDISDADEEKLRDALRIKKGKSHSGIISITVFTSGYPEYTDRDTGERKTQTFSCHWNCAYCPNEPGQPRSYLKGEPGVLRANRQKFVCVDQMHDRMQALFVTGHPIDKLEVLVLGGTIASYPDEYIEEFMRDIYYAANVFGDAERRIPLSLAEEKAINKTAKCKVIGLTLETRPDTITPEVIRKFRYYGCTRVQLGIQHIDDGVLKTIRRQCSTATTINAIRLLKDCGYKIDGHWMPNLPGSNVKLDDWMLNDQLLGVDKKTYMQGGTWETWTLRRPDLQVDQWKVYPCTLVPYTDIMEWYKQGTYVPYGQEELMDLLIKMKSLVFPWIRLNRVIRDIPSDYVVKSDYRSNLRQELDSVLRQDGWYCSCIRCREVKTNEVDLAESRMITREYEASGGTEYFISKEVGNTLLGFVRLRLSPNIATHVFPELDACALVRELHVYGLLKVVGKSGSEATQHRGIGKELMAKAEEITRRNKSYQKIAVIAGEGTRGYYEKLGYQDCGAYMIKTL